MRPWVARTSSSSSLKAVSVSVVMVPPDRRGADLIEPRMGAPMGRLDAGSELHRWVRFDEDIGCAKSFEHPVLSSIRQRREQERVEREPKAHPDQHPPSRINDQVGVPAGAHDARLDDHEKESHDDDGEPYP